MKINLDVKIIVEIEENGKDKESLSIFLREFTKVESKEYKTLFKEFSGFVRKSEKLERQLKSTNKRLNIAGKMDDNDLSLKLLDKIDKIENDLDKVRDDLEKLAGDNFEESMAEKSFNLLVSGDGKEKLKEYAEIKGYSNIMSSLRKAKEDIEKKPHSE